MNEKETGGPAFPVLGSKENGHAADGMSPRDCFAIRALPLAIKYWTQADADIPGGGIFEWYTYQADDDCLPAAELAYRMADAMLIARNGT